MKFKDEEVKNIFRVVAGILLIGNIKFTKSKNNKMMPCGIKEESKEAVRYIAKNFGIEEKTLINGITIKPIMHKNKTENIFLTLNQCKRKQNRLAASLYQHLFH